MSDVIGPTRCYFGIKKVRKGGEYMSAVRGFEKGLVIGGFERGLLQATRYFGVSLARHVTARKLRKTESIYQ